MKRPLLSVLVVVLVVISSPAAGQEVTWEPTAMANTDVHVRTLFVAADGTVFAGTDDGLLRSTTNGESWEAVGPVGVNDFEELSPGVLVAVGREGVHHSADGGVTWTQVLPKPLVEECVDFMQYTYVVSALDGEVFAGSIEEDVGSVGCKIDAKMFRTTDGISWSRVTGTTFGDSQAALPVSPDTLIHGGDGGSITLYFNLSTGLSISREFIIELGGSVTELVMTHNRRVYAATGPSIQGVVKGTGIHRSTDNGETWEQVNSGLTDVSVTDLAVYSTGTLLAATLHGGVHRSTNDGDSWIPVNEGLSSLKVTALAITDEGFVFVATNKGIYRSTSAIAVPTEPEAELPERLALGRNFPNPFNPTTTIPFELAEPAFVTLRVYDSLGREVRTLLNEFRTPGRWEVSFSAEDLPSGVYVYRLEAGALTRTAPMTLLR